MSEDVQDHPTTGPDQSSGSEAPVAAVRTYLYLRLAIIGLLVSLAVAVGYQAIQQQVLLASVSAYYYTPAQTIFVGALIGFGACMIALKGTSAVEDVFLNLAGMFAAAVAVVPTSRGDDYDSALKACTHAAAALVGNPGSGLDCPTVQALAATTRADVANNMLALVVVALGGLVAAWLFAAHRPRHRGWWRGPAAASLVWLAGLTGLLNLGWLVDHGHFVAAGGLLVCIVGVAAANAFRHTRAISGKSPTPQGARSPTMSPLDRYAILGALMLVVTAGGIVLNTAGVLSVFWLEMIIAALFIALWTTQTVELQARA